MFGDRKNNCKLGNKIINYNEDYLVSNFTKEELEQILVGKVVKFWTKDCQIMPDFTVTAPVTSISYFKNGEIAINILRNKTGRTSKILNLSSRMVKLKFRIISD